MAGQDVFKFAVRSVPSVIEAALKQAGLEKDQVDWLVMHQANQRILDAAATRLGLPAERVSASWLAVARARGEGGFVGWWWWGGESRRGWP
jgi:3-oxoacyl-[acyl-carrier-protein] synthase III